MLEIPLFRATFWSGSGWKSCCNFWPGCPHSRFWIREDWIQASTLTHWVCQVCSLLVRWIKASDSSILSAIVSRAMQADVSRSVCHGIPRELCSRSAGCKFCKRRIQLVLWLEQVGALHTSCHAALVPCSDIHTRNLDDSATSSCSLSFGTAGHTADPSTDVSSAANVVETTGNTGGTAQQAMLLMLVIEAGQLGNPVSVVVQAFGEPSGYFCFFLIYWFNFIYDYTSDATLLKYILSLNFQTLPFMLYLTLFCGICIMFSTSTNRINCPIFRRWTVAWPLTRGA